MKITLSKNQWEGIGKKAGWMKEAQSEGYYDSQRAQRSQRSFDNAQRAYDNMTPPDDDDPMEDVQFRKLPRRRIAQNISCNTQGCKNRASFVSDRPCLDDGDPEGGGAHMYLCVGCYFKMRKEIGR